MHVSAAFGATLLRPVRIPFVAFSLILALLAGALGVAAPVRAGAAQLKAVIVVGPTHGSTASYLAKGESLAKVAEYHGMDVHRVFHPKATFANVMAAGQGANMFVYLGHGNGWPSPYGPFQEKSKNGMGLNPYEGGSANNVEYYGAKPIREQLVLAPNALVLFNHLCYAAGNGESGMAIPSWNVAHQRVDNFAAGFLAAGARGVFAYSWQSLEKLVKELFTTNKTTEQLFTTTGSTASPSSGFVGWDARKLESVRTPGTVNYLDPHSKDGFLRAFSGDLTMTASDWRSGASNGAKGDTRPGDGSIALPPDVTPPSVPTELNGVPVGYRRVALSWQPSTDDRPGAMTYRLFRNGVRIAKLTGTTFTDRPSYAGTYRYKVRAVDAAGNKSAFTPIIYAKSVKGPLP
jgi:hypothetical protein